MLKKIIAAMVILVALLLIFSNQISNLYVKRQSERLARNAIQEITAEQIQNNNKNTAADDEAAMWDWDQVQALSVDQTFEQLQMRMRQAQANRQTTPASQAMSSTSVPATGTGASDTAAEPSNDPRRGAILYRGLHHRNPSGPLHRPGDRSPAGDLKR